MLINGTSERIPLADGSVHCVVTSPPYFGLRDYGLPPSVWGGKPDCRHVWGDESEVKTGRNDADRRATWGEFKQGDFVGAHAGGNRKASQGQFCRHCDAWRGCLGLEPSIELYVAHLVQIFREIRRVLRDDGTCWLNLGDSYAGSGKGSKVGEPGITGGTRNQEEYVLGFDKKGNGLRSKDQCLIPHRVALALQQPFLQCRCGAINHKTAWGHFPNGRLICPDCAKSQGWSIETPGWWLRSTIVWAKKNPMPESVTDRPALAHENIFLLTKKLRYFYDLEAVKEPCRTPMDSTVRQGFGSVKGKNNTNERARSNGVGKAWEKTPTRNLRTVWNIATQPYAGAHFATFPPKLVEPCIKAGTSQRGCCPACGAGWVEVVELTPEYQELLESGQAWRDKSRNPDEYTKRQQKGHVSNVPTKNKTTGWRPACDCYRTRNLERRRRQDIAGSWLPRVVRGKAPTVPAFVLDPFCGSGTTGYVARQLGRYFIGIDLSIEYLAKNALPRAEKKTSQAAIDELPLFSMNT